MRALQLLVLACASLAVSGDMRIRKRTKKHAPITEFILDFDGGCLQRCNGYFWDAVKARDCFESVPRVPGKCESVKITIKYTIDEISRCASINGSVVEGVGLKSLIRKELSTLGHSGDLFIDKAAFNYQGAVTGDCHTASIRGTGKVNRGCTTLTQKPYAMRSALSEEGTGVVFSLSDWKVAVKYADSAVQATFGKTCVIPGKAKNAIVDLVFYKTLEASVAIKDATIVFPDQPDCAPRGCNAIVGARGVKVCLDNARKAPSCKRAIYTRTYFNLDNGPCDPSVPEKFHINMDHILVDDKALNFEDKHTSVTRIQFTQKPEDDNCTGSVVRFTNSCSAGPAFRSILEEDPKGSFTFTGDEEVTPGVVATNYTLTTGCGLIDNPDGGEVTMRTQFAISHPKSSSTIKGSRKSPAGVGATNHTLSARTGISLIDNSEGDEVLETQSTTLQPRSSSTSRGDGASTAGVVATNYTLTTKSDIIDNRDADEVTTKAHSASLRSKPSGSYGRIPLAGLLTTGATILCICSQ